MIEHVQPNPIKVSNLLGGVPKECRGKYASNYRGVLEFSELYPNLSHTELVELTTAVSNTPPSSYQRIKVIDYYTNLNSSKNVSQDF
jgi:hypothetical protein